MQKSLDGIGALLSMTDGGQAEIKGLVVGGPAQTAGELQVGDRITHVGQGMSGEMQDILHMKLQKVVDLIRGKRGSVVRLRVIPNGKDPSDTVDILIKRNRVELEESLARAELIETKDEKGAPSSHRLDRSPVVLQRHGHRSDQRHQRYRTPPGPPDEGRNRWIDH